MASSASAACWCRLPVVIALGWMVWVGSFWLLDTVSNLVPYAWEANFSKAQIEGAKGRFIQDPVVDGAVDNTSAAW